MGIQTMSDEGAEYSEISLIDLAKILVKRRKFFYAVFTFIFLAGLVFALLSESKFQYTTIYKLAEAGEDAYVEPVAASVATVEEQFIPKFVDRYRQDNGQRPPFSLNVNSPKESGLLILTSNATQDNAERVGLAHKTIVEKLAARESRLIAAMEDRLTSRLESVDKVIERLEGVKESGSALAGVYEDRLELEIELSNLQPGGPLVLSRESLDKVSTSRAIMGVVTVMIAVFMGIFAAFVAEFVSAVRKSMESE